MQKNYGPKGLAAMDSLPRTIPKADLVSGRMAGGRVTAWSIQCDQCSSIPGAPSLVINPTTKAKASAALRAHYAAHSEGRL